MAIVELDRSHDGSDYGSASAFGILSPRTAASPRHTVTKYSVCCVPPAATAVSLAKAPFAFDPSLGPTHPTHSAPFLTPYLNISTSVQPALLLPFSFFFMNAAFGDDDLRILRSLLSPSLTSLRITVRWSSYLIAEFGSFMEQLRLITPVLTEFELIGSFDIVEPRFAKSVLQIPTDSESLQRLCRDTDTFIAAADQLPVMKSLVFLRLTSGNRRSTAAPLSLSIPKSVFPALQTIAGSQDDISMQILTELIPSVGHSIMHFEASRTSTTDRWEATEPVSLDTLPNVVSLNPRGGLYEFRS
jgi:hypothetical protein